MISSFKQWCADLIAWRRAHHGALPRQHSEKAQERRLGKWVSKAVLRKARALGSAPSQVQLTPEEASMLDAVLAPGFCSEEEAAADASTPGLRREVESVAVLVVKPLRMQSPGSADPALRQEEITADAFTAGLRHEEDSVADVEKQRLREDLPAAADPFSPCIEVFEEETAANVQKSRCVLGFKGLGVLGF